MYFNYGFIDICEICGKQMYYDDISDCDICGKFVCIDCSGFNSEKELCCLTCLGDE